MEIDRIQRKIASIHLLANEATEENEKDKRDRIRKCASDIIDLVNKGRDTMEIQLVEFTRYDEVTYEQLVYSTVLTKVSTGEKVMTTMDKAIELSRWQRGFDCYA